MGGYCFGIPMLIQRRKLDERTINLHSLPSIKADDDAVRLEKDVMIRLLESLRNGVQLPFVRTGVVRLRFSRNGAHEVSVYTEREADDLDRFLNVRFPVASLFAGINGRDTNLFLLLAVRRLVELREQNLAGVLCPSQEINHLLLGLRNGFAFVLQGSDAFGEE